MPMNTQADIDRAEQHERMDRGEREMAQRREHGQYRRGCKHAVTTAVGGFHFCVACGRRAA